MSVDYTGRRLTWEAQIAAVRRKLERAIERRDFARRDRDKWKARAEKAEARFAVAIDWIEGIPCLGRPGLLEDKQAILAALKRGAE